MDFDTILQTAGLIGGGAAVGGPIVSGATGLIKNILPDSWQHGRAVLAVVYGLSAGLVVASMAAMGPVAEGTGAAVLIGFLAWQGIATAAVGVREVVQKVGAIASSSTNPSGPDPQ